MPAVSRPHEDAPSLLPARAALAVSLACLAATVVIERSVVAGTRFDAVSAAPGYGTTLTGVFLAGCAFVLLRHGARRGLGWAMAGAAVFWALDGVAESYLRLGLGREDALPGMTLAAWFLLRPTALLPATVAVVLAVFPTGRVLAGRWGVAARAALGVMVLNAVVFVVLPSSSGPGGDRLPPGTDPDPTTIRALEPIGAVLRTASLAASLVALAVVLATVVVRYRRSHGLDRDRMRWLAWAVAVIVLLSLVDVVTPEGLEPLLFFVVVNLGPAAMTVAVVSPRLVPIDDLLSRTLVYGGLSVAILLIDLAALAGVTAVLGERIGDRQVVLMVLLLSAVLYNPLRAWIWALVRRLVLGERDDPYDVVAGLASSLEAADEGTEQLTEIAQAVATAFGIGFVSVEVDRGNGERSVAAHGQRPPETRELPITYRSETVGVLVLPARGIRARLSARDQRLLGDLVRQAATAARTGRLADELQENRRRLVVAREEERRRIRHDLHEDLGPTLGGLVFQVESARLLVRERPEAAKETIARTSAHLREVVADVRRVVHDLRPPALDDRGLVGALRQQAELATTETLEVRVEGDRLDGLPAAVEVAAFRIAGAVLDQVRCSRATSCVLRLRREERGLVVEVDGDAVLADQSLHQRAAELGGRTEVLDRDGRTVVRAWLPVREQP